MPGAVVPSGEGQQGFQAPGTQLSTGTQSRKPAEPQPVGPWGHRTRAHRPGPGPTCLRPFLGDSIVRPHSPAADPRGPWPSPTRPTGGTTACAPLPWLPVPSPHLLLPDTDAGKVCWESLDSTSVRRTGGACGPPGWGQQGGLPLTLRCRNSPCAVGTSRRGGGQHISGALPPCTSGYKSVVAKGSGDGP